MKKNYKMQRKIISFLFVYLSIILVSCDDNNDITIKLDKYDTAVESDFICDIIYAYWCPDSRYFVEHVGESDLSFSFTINKSNPFVCNIDSSSINYYDIKFVFELQGTIDKLEPGFFFPSVELNNRTYWVGLNNLQFHDNKLLRSFKDIKRKKDKIKAFKDIISNCKIYAINSKGKKMGIKIIKETSLLLYKDC